MIFLPELHQLGLTDADWEGLCTLAEARQVDNEGLLRIQTNAALLGRWDVVYALSYLAGLETSVLIDAEDNVSIDWGSPGRVALSPPVGCAAPFKVWTHTHPGFDAYWSGTDTNSLANGSSIVARALVLGAPGMKQALNQSLSTEPISGQRIMKSGPLNLWSDEEITPWTAFYEQLDTSAKYEVNA
jgi:hypothetical protein